MKKDENKSSASPFVERIERLTTVQRVVIYAVTFLLIIGLFAWLAYFPKTEKISELKTKYNDLEGKLATARIEAAQIEKFRAEKRAAEAKFEEVKRKLPEKEEIPSLLAGISRSGNDSGLEFLLFRPEKEQSRDFYAEIPVSINVSGSYHNVGTFYDKVATLPRIVNIGNVSMQPQGKAGNLLTTQCKATTYKFVEKQASEDKSGKKGKKKKRKR